MRHVHEPLRKAALALASLNAADRGWLLARLDSGERTRLAPLLSELRGLGLVLDPGAVRELLAEERNGATAAPAASAGAHPLDGAAAHAVFEALADEPDTLIALVVQARAWPWRGDLLVRLGEERRQRVERLAQAPSVIPARTVQAVLTVLEERLP